MRKIGVDIREKKSYHEEKTIGGFSSWKKY